MSSGCCYSTNEAGLFSHGIAENEAKREPSWLCRHTGHGVLERTISYWDLSQASRLSAVRPKDSTSSSSNTRILQYGSTPKQPSGGSGILSMHPCIFLVRDAGLCRSRTARDGWIERRDCDSFVRGFHLGRPTLRYFLNVLPLPLRH